MRFGKPQADTDLAYENIIVNVLGVEGWKALVRRVTWLLPVFEGVSLDDDRFILRRDTLNTLAEIVQDGVIRMIGRAHSIP